MESQDESSSSQLSYYEKHRNHIRESQNQYYREHKDEFLERQRRARANLREKAKAYDQLMKSQTA